MHDHLSHESSRPAAARRQHHRPERHRAGAGVRHHRPAASAGAVERTAAELGRLDTLISNAGVMLLGPIAGAPLEEWQRMVELNLLGLLYCAHAALPPSAARRR